MRISRKLNNLVYVYYVRGINKSNSPIVSLYVYRIAFVNNHVLHHPNELLQLFYFHNKSIVLIV